ncbi:uncharacterized protein si:dkey-261h17.1 [Colossoma macropomum]|uniref:uncharacterized protein si:dkey-261h17.1 n=1 Tax=Colossoma macropomum TaxID=42526 RepID=UPI0018643C8F|nr:uncharacterized protein si:dkey-261h17.1 [Colossoma macropomum]
MAMRKMNEMWRRMALALALCVLLFHSCLGQDTSPASPVALTVTRIVMLTNPTTAPATGAANAPTDTAISNAPEDTKASQTIAPVTVKDAVSSLATDQATTAAPSGGNLNSFTVMQEIDILKFFDKDDSAGPEKTSIVVKTSQPFEMRVRCVEKEAVQDRVAVKVELETASNCDATRSKIEAQMRQLCPELNCNFEIFQEENSKNVIVTGSNVTGDVNGIADRLAGIKADLGVVTASAEQQSNQKPKIQSPAVFVSVLVAGLALGAGLVGGYLWKNRHSNAKGMKLAEESMMPDEENQGNTLVSVAPLNPPEPQEKPSLNGESPEAVKTQNPPAATNGHSATKTADTEL